MARLDWYDGMPYAQLASRLSRMKPGDMIFMGRHQCHHAVWKFRDFQDGDDVSLERAEARQLWAKFGAVKDDGLRYAQWVVDWRNMGPAPIVRLSSDLFAHVADAAEAS